MWRGEEFIFCFYTLTHLLSTWLDSLHTLSYCHSEAKEVVLSVNPNWHKRKLKFRELKRLHSQPLAQAGHTCLSDCKVFILSLPMAF